MQRYFQISCHALIVSAFAALALTGRLDSPSILAVSIGLGVSIYRTIYGMSPLLAARSAFLLCCGYIFFFAFDSIVLSSSFIPATIHLVLFLQLTKLFQEKSDKDYLYLIVLSFLQVLAAASLTIDISFVAALFLFMVALVSTLMSFDMYRCMRKLSMEAEHIAVPLGSMSLWSTIWIIVTGIVFFFLIPRIGTGYFSRADTPSLLLSGFTETVRLGEIGQVKLSSAVVMHAKQINGAPFGVLKWRGIALDSFDGHHWSKTIRRRTGVRPSADDQYWLHPASNSGDHVRYQILLEPLATTALFGPHQVLSISGRLQGIEVDGNDSIYMRVQTVRRVQYEVFSEVPSARALPADSAAERQTPPEIAAQYLQLPSDLDSQIPQLASEITAKGSSVTEKAALVEGYLKRNYRYTLNLNWTPGPQPLSTFLFKAKAGHCEYFASSMAILLRSVGIPTRLVNGFLMGEYNPIGGDYIIRESDAHSWVEVYTPGRGWMEFDPTPPDPNPRELDLAAQVSQYFDAMEVYWNSYILIYDYSSQLQLFRGAQDRVQSIQTTGRRKSDEWVKRAQAISDRFAARIRHLVESAGFWGVLEGLILAGLAYKHRKRLKIAFQIWRLRHGGGRVNDDVVELLFYRAARLAERRHAKRRPAQTWREWIFGLPDPNRRSILKRALEVFEKSKYGHMPVSRAEFTLLEDAIRELKS